MGPGSENLRQAETFSGACQSSGLRHTPKIHSAGSILVTNCYHLSLFGKLQCFIFSEFTANIRLFCLRVLVTNSWIWQSDNFCTTAYISVPLCQMCWICVWWPTSQIHRWFPHYIYSSQSAAKSSLICLVQWLATHTHTMHQQSALSHWLSLVKLVSI